MEKKAFSIPETVEVLGVSRTSIYELFKQGELASFHVGRRRFVPRDQVDRFIDRRMAESA